MNGIGLLVGNLNAEFLRHCQLPLPHAARIATDLLNRHDYFYGIQAVKTEVVVEVGLGVELCKISNCFTEWLCEAGNYLGGVVNLRLR